MGSPDASSPDRLTGQRVMRRLWEIDDLLRIEGMVAIAPADGSFTPRNDRRLNISGEALAYLLALGVLQRAAFFEYFAGPFPPPTEETPK
ncbi:hypothetical protein [Nocardioides sp. Arc9.136]|uniref:hypothetical protein n=1 Tax=Nocardioides sp. Arc9.136 TaxID=2996826 RepID=UPI0026653C92|nr:hypothetical protein [Nocardioides sp. Arc9.136]WKN47465.1 hypothetical protein OSR43_15665 [Nocardioides sp. Arc9.136]